MRILFCISVVVLFMQCSPTGEVIGSFVFYGTEVQVVKYSSGKPGPLYFNMHDNENTSVEAARRLVGSKGGKLYELVHSGDRNICFDWADTLTYEIDPNRIYTEAGVWRELERTARRDTQVFDLVKAFGDSLLTLLNVDQQDLVVALHNNTDCRYCLYSYMEGGPYEKDALRTFQAERKEPDDFYFVTTDAHFNALQGNGFHIVQQDNAQVTDDGSLSVYCGQRGIDYINVEAEHGNLHAQKRMIRRMIKSLGEYYR
jgi:hypothetical protein